MNDRYQELEHRFIAWAETQPDIRAAIVMGSRARLDHPVDKYSDLDIIVAAINPDHYLNRSDWLEQIAPVWISLLSRTAGGEPERLTLFESGFFVDFVFIPPDMLRQAAEAGIIPDGFKRGARAILDKDGLAARTIPATFVRPIYLPPSAAEYGATVDTFWYAAIYVAKQLCREDLWLVKVRHGNLLELLMRIIEWHAHAVYGPERDTWHMGRFAREWADPRAVQALNGVFAHFDAADSWRALFATLDTFRWLAQETAGRLGFDYPQRTDTRVTQLIQQMADNAGQNKP